MNFGHMESKHCTNVNKTIHCLHEKIKEPKKKKTPNINAHTKASADFVRKKEQNCAIIR